ncbi:Bacterial Cytochrome Ubiquinol Oxidase [Rubrobacter radiotolerans]|uniref:Bacterial Cytochrome Ubiquinol Oxidase n=1 Tax=Rubrobacter radiotolerans TaxID=42256 RepID=A0A023WZV0_RUBRA|nr:cytochrome ubiquinol oxidase subunit I [Rubrobacter radiotolerans]AHY45573.1 Bacterial Cytochrome Ubiquinol Oxidase [Rubrobacter radiotolerans]MDX5892987.1 cytochrome ubiquinol oxidase subunit I [Rubrobacter radiotolerans]SMC02860.1 cytochrome d ubiquinol oxidase subunit I [Rubrobacter radiotolerans DSM 5868]
MPIGNIDVPVIGKNVTIAVLVQGHILFAAFIIGAVLIAATSEYLGMVTKQPRYERFARNLARFVVLLFASGAALAITFVVALITLFPVFFSYLQNVFFWVFLVEAFMFLGQIIIVYAWYNVWDKLAYRKALHVVFGFVAGFLGLMAMTMIDAVASFMLTPSESAASDAASTFLNQTMVPLNMHRFVGNFGYAGFLIAGWAAWRYLRTTREDDREYYDWMGHFGLLWGFGFTMMQPVIGYGYLKGIRESAPAAFDTIMLGDKAWTFNLLMIWLTIMGIAGTAYFVHKLRFTVRPMPLLRKLAIGGLAFTALFSILNVIPANASLIPQIGLVFANGADTTIPLGSMYPWKYIGLIGLMLVGFFVIALYLKATASGFQWGRASRWSQYALIACAVTVVFTMITMGYTRETARRVDNEPGYLIYNCITLDQQLTPETCPVEGLAGGSDI